MKRSRRSYSCFPVSRFHVCPSELVQRSPLSVVMTNTGGSLVTAGGAAGVFALAAKPCMVREDVSSCTGGDASTVTVWAVWPTASTMFVTACCAGASTAVCVCRANPAARTSRWYTPGGSPSTTYRPAASVCTVRVSAVRLSAATTMAPGIAAPLASVTAPLRLLLASASGCAEATAPAVNRSGTARENARLRGGRGFVNAVATIATFTARPCQGTETAFQCRPSSSLKKSWLRVSSASFRCRFSASDSTSSPLGSGACAPREAFLLIARPVA